jgi:hypothetical protein
MVVALTAFYQANLPIGLLQKKILGSITGQNPAAVMRLMVISELIRKHFTRAVKYEGWMNPVFYEGETY